jgi:hypothetical protein
MGQTRLQNGQLSPHYDFGKLNFEIAKCRGGSAVRHAVLKSRAKTRSQELAIVSADALGYQHGPVIRKRDETLIEEGIDVRGQQNPMSGSRRSLSVD